MGLRAVIVSGALLIAGFAGVTALRYRQATRQPPLPVLAQVGDFTVTNQLGQSVTSEALRGHPWVANLIFTRCPGPCPQLTGVMRRIQDGLARTSSSRLVSLTSDPEFDTPSVLAAYARRFGADERRWQFVTGTRDQIRRLAVDRLLLVLQDKTAEQRESPEDLFLHSTLIVVVDAAGRLRTAVEGLAPAAAEQVLEALSRLEREP